MFTHFPARVHAALFALSVAREGRPSEEENAEAKEGWGGMERTTTATMAALHHDCFSLNVTGLSLDSPPLAKADSRAAPVLVRW